MFYYIDQPRTSSYPIRLVKTKSDFIVRLVETGVWRWTQVLAVISVDAYPVLAFSDLRITKITSRIDVSWTHSLLFCFNLFLTKWIMAILSKGCKPDNFEPQNSLKLSFTSIRGLRFCWMCIFPCIKLSWHSCSVWDKLGWVNWFW